MSMPAQGTQLYFEDPESGEVVEVACITELTGLSSARDQVEDTCLSDDARSYTAGLATPGTANFGIYTDPRESSHIRLHELFIAGTKLNWAAGWSDGKGIAPTGADSDGLTLPSTRTWLTFEGFVSDFPFDFAQNSNVASNLAIQTSGFPVWIPKA